MWDCIQAVLICIFAYFIGAIPTGYWLGKLVKGIDIRKVGSGSIGATNVLRCVGKGAALFVLVFDIAKGFMAVALAMMFDSDCLGQGSRAAGLLPCLCGLLAILGHSKSIFLGFQGGKSAACGLGTLLAMNYVAALATFAVFVTTILVFRMVSLGSLLSSFLTPVFMYLAGGKVSFIIYCVCGALFVAVRHKANIKRILTGCEPKLGQPSSKELLAVLVLAAISLLVSLPVQAKGARAGNTSKQTAVMAKRPDFITGEEGNNIRVYKMVSKAVVNITALASSEEVFFGISPQSGTGSGSIISPDGYILTNNHVIGNARMVRAILFDGSTYPASVVGTDPDNDLAVLKIDPQAKKLVTVQMGDSSRLEVGRRVYAIGNPFGLDLTMTAGIISSVGRTLKTESGRLIKGVLQTDAAINPGNSGGPLLNSQGQMVGITTAILSKSGQSAGIGFAIPINVVKRIVPQLIQYHAVLRPDLGILMVRPVELGLMVMKLDPSGPCAQAGLRGPVVKVYQYGGFTIQNVDNASADIIVNVDKIKVQSVDDLLSYIETKKPGQVVTLNILRQGKLLEIPVKLANSTNSPQ